MAGLKECALLDASPRIANPKHDVRTHARLRNDFVHTLPAVQAPNALCGDTTPLFSATWKDWYFHTEDSGQFSVVDVHVVGSFARGAPECGDLDLVVAVDIVSGRKAPDRTIGHLISRRSPRVQVHIGAPKQNSSGVMFPEAVFLWSKNDRDWRSRLAAMPVNPNATRFERKTDRLPLRLAQLRLYNLEHAEEAAERIRTGELISRWHPLSEIAPAAASWPPYRAPAAGGAWC